MHMREEEVVEVEEEGAVGESKSSSSSETSESKRASPHLTYTTRPSKPFSCVAAKYPLIRSARQPVAPLMTKPAARALSSATARATAAAYSAPCAKAKRVTREGEGGKICALLRAHAAAAHLAFRIRSRRNLHARLINPGISIHHYPYA